MEILYLGKIKKIEINAVKKHVNKNKQKIFEFLIFFKLIIAPGILQIANTNTGTI